MNNISKILAQKTIDEIIYIDRYNDRKQIRNCVIRNVSHIRGKRSVIQNNPYLYDKIKLIRNIKTQSLN